jgi:hypothetical protein
LLESKKAAPEAKASGQPSYLAACILHAMKRSWKANSFFIALGLEELGFQVSKACKASNGRTFMIRISAEKPKDDA